MWVNRLSRAPLLFLPCHFLFIFLLHDPVFPHSEVRVHLHSLPRKTSKGSAECSAKDSFNQEAIYQFFSFAAAFACDLICFFGSWEAACITTTIAATRTPNRGVHALRRTHALIGLLSASPLRGTVGRDGTRTMVRARAAGHRRDQRGPQHTTRTTHPQTPPTLPQRARGRFEQRERAVRSRRSRVRGAPTLAGEEPHGAIDFAVRRRRRGARERADDAVRRRHRRVALSAVRPRRGGRDGVDE